MNRISTAYLFVSFIIDAKELQKVVTTRSLSDNILEKTFKQLKNKQIFFIISKKTFLFNSKKTLKHFSN